MHTLGLLLDTARADVVFSWFASVYGSLAVLWGRFLGKRTIIQIGGVDMAKDDASGYGTWTSAWRSFIVGRALRFADHVLVVDQSLGSEARQRAAYAGENIEVLETRFSPEEWCPEGEKEDHVLTVAMVDDMARARVKGLDLLLLAAERSPSFRFLIVGVHKDVESQLRIPPNVAIEGPLGTDELRRRMQSAKVYCQPSRREGLSNALCEAMLCGCIPVATDVGGSRRAVGTTGFVVSRGDERALADAIARAMGTDSALGLEARERIKTEFPEDKRLSRLRAIIES